MLLGGLSTVAVLLGMTIASLANRYPQRRPIMEIVAGWLLIAGFGLIGAGLSFSESGYRQNASARALTFSNWTMQNETTCSLNRSIHRVAAGNC